VEHIFVKTHMFLWCYVYVMSRTKPLPEHNDDEWRELGKCALPTIEILPEGYREALLLTEIDSLPLKEVAERLNLSLSGVKSRVQRGLERLKRAFLNCCMLSLIAVGSRSTCGPRKAALSSPAEFFSRLCIFSRSLSSLLLAGVQARSHWLRIGDEGELP
jgi:Sigma-70, region 4